MSDTKNIFISHIHEDDPALKDLKNLLSNNGMTPRDYSVTADNPNNAHNEDYIKYQILAPRIQRSSALVVYISADMRFSRWVNWEIEHAAREGKTIVGVYEHGAAGCELPQGLENVRDALVVSWRGNDIIDAIEGRLGESRQPNGNQHAPRDIDRHDCGNR